ncbi:MAG: hypothetical protein WA930_07250 [Rhodanobacter sp.]|jgi:hypothetical protein
MNDADKGRDKAILVLGMHRSGTSALTRVLNLLGVDLGGNFLKPAGDNRLGFWEHSDVVALHEKLLHALGRSWDDTRALPVDWELSPAAGVARKEIATIINRDFSGSRLWAIKDPRLCRLAPLWVESIAALGVDVCALLVVRHPQEVANSLHVRDGLDAADARLSWLEYFVEAEHATRSLPRALVLYDDLLVDWQRVMTAASQQLRLQWPKSIEYAAPAVAAFLDTGERHHKASKDDGSATPDIAAELYRRCVAWTQGDGQWSGIAALVDAYRLVAPTFLENMSRNLTRIAEVTSHLEKAEALANDRQEEIAARKEEIRDGVRRIHGLLETLHGKELNIGNMVEIIRGKDATIQNRDDAIQDRMAEIKRRDELLSVKDAEIRRRDETIQDKEAQIARLDQALADRESRLHAQVLAREAAEEQVALLGDALQDKEQRLRSAEDTLRGNLQRIDELDAAQRKKEAQLIECNAELNAAKRGVNMLTEQLAGLRGELSSNLQRIGELDAAQRKKEAQLVECNAELNAAKRSVTMLTEQLAGLRGEISNLVAQERAGQVQAAELRARIADIEASRSWRITGPLRALKSRWLTRKSTAVESAPGNEASAPVTREPAKQPIADQTVMPSAVGTPPAVGTAEFNLRGKECAAVILTTRHCHHVALEIKSALRRVSISAEIIFEMPHDGYRDVPHFVICPQFFERLPGLYVSFQMEQSVSSRWFTDEYVRVLRNSFAIFDYSIANIAKLEELGLYAKQIYHVPVGYLDEYEERGISDNYDCDVLFYGDIQNERRRCFIEALGRVCRVKVHNDLFGDALHAEMARARLVVNIHYYQGALLETTRLWECVSLGHLVISERAADMDQHPELQQLVDFVDVDDLPAMVTRVGYWLNNDNLRRQRLEQNARLLQELPNQFDFHFYRFLLATDNISFDEFWNLAGSKLKLPGDKLCLSLPEYVTRSQSFDHDNRFGFVRFTGLRHSLGWIGCAMSYKLMMRLGRQEGRQMLVICEDDVEFPPDFEARWSRIQAHLMQTLPDWDVFSGLMANLHDGARIARTYEESGLRYVETDKLISMVFNVYGAGVFDIADTWDESDRDENTNTIDRYLERQSALRVLTTVPFLVGHKEELHSTLWGFQNTQYSELIAASNALLSEKLAAHLHDRVGTSPV